ncbi:hypothetical protein QUF74_13220 [Candidatus Halobeggiatoa sp. HSG11]|nr:hypothetical protein [Candidatus Halobeggiatoa sp. HSG11]
MQKHRTSGEYSYDFADILRLILFDTHRRRGVMALPHGMWERDKRTIFF